MTRSSKGLQTNSGKSFLEVQHSEHENDNGKTLDIYIDTLLYNSRMKECLVHKKVDAFIDG